MQKKENRERENNKNGRKRERQCKQRNIFPSKRERTIKMEKEVRKSYITVAEKDNV